MSTDREVEALDDQRESASLNIFNVKSNQVQDKCTSSSVATAGQEEEMSLPPNTVGELTFNYEFIFFFFFAKALLHFL